MPRFLPLILLCAAANAAEVSLPPAPPQMHFDTESVTNAPFSHERTSQCQTDRNLVSMFVACMTHAEGVVSNAPAKTGFRIDINDLPSESIPFICVAPRLASSAPADTGTGRLRVILGAIEYAHVFNAVSGLCGDDKNVAFERGDGRTTLTFGNGLRIVVDDATGEIQTPPGLPSVSDVELADLTWARMESSGALVKWRSLFWESDGVGGPSRRLSEIRLDEVFRVSDKTFVAWRLLADPPLNGSQLVRLVFWIDIPSRSIISEGSEINLRRPSTPQS